MARMQLHYMEGKCVWNEADHDPILYDDHVDRRYPFYGELMNAMHKLSVSCLWMGNQSVYP